MSRCLSKLGAKINGGRLKSYVAVVTWRRQAAIFSRLSGVECGHSLDAALGSNV